MRTIFVPSLIVLLAACSNGEVTEKRTTADTSSEGSDSIGVRGDVNEEMSFSLALPEEFKVPNEESLPEQPPQPEKPMPHPQDERIKIACIGKFAASPEKLLGLYFSKIAFAIQIKTGDEVKEIKQSKIYSCPGAAQIVIKGARAGSKLSLQAVFHNFKGNALYKGEVGPINVGDDESTKMVMKRVEKDANVVIDVVFDDKPNKPEKPGDDNCKLDMACADYAVPFAQCSSSFVYTDMAFFVEHKGPNACYARIKVMKELCGLSKKYPKGKQMGKILCSESNWKEDQDAGGDGGGSEPHHPKDPVKPKN